MEENRILKELGIERAQRDYASDNYPYGPANDNLLGYMAPHVAMPLLTAKTRNTVDPNYVPPIGEMIIDHKNGDVYVGDGIHKVDDCYKIINDPGCYINDAQVSEDCKSLDFTFNNGETTSVSIYDYI